MQICVKIETNQASTCLRIRAPSTRRSIEQVRFFIFLRIIISVTKTNCYSHYVGTCTECAVLYWHLIVATSEREKAQERWKVRAIAIVLRSKWIARWMDVRSVFFSASKNTHAKRIENDNCCTTKYEMPKKNDYDDDEKMNVHVWNIYNTWSTKTVRSNERQIRWNFSWKKREL